MPRRALDNPIVPAVLGLLLEQPSHPHKLLADLRARSESHASAATRGTLYNTVAALAEAGWFFDATADEAAAAADLVLPGHSDALRDAARAFDEITYGGRTADDTTYRHLSALDAALRRAKPADTRRAPAGRP